VRMNSFFHSTKDSIAERMSASPGNQFLVSKPIILHGVRFAHATFHSIMLRG